jgi:hypothetical protein
MILTAKKKLFNFGRHHQVYILPTKEGLIFFGLQFIFILMGLGYQNNLILLTEFILLVFTVFTMIEAHFYLQTLKISKIIIPDIYENDPLKIFWEIENKENQLMLSYRSFLKNDYIKLSKLGDRIYSNELGFKRGYYQNNEMTLSSVFPLGFFKVWIYLPLKTEFYVYPSPIHHPSEVLSDDSKTSMHVSQKSGDEDFEALKEWSSGESLSRIHWKKLASHNQWLIKEMNSPVGQSAWLQVKYPITEKHLSELTGQMLLAKDLGYVFRLSNQHFDSGWNSGEEHLKLCLRNLSKIKI